MGHPTLACMIATLGRPTLPAAIASAIHQFDQVLVIADACDLDHLDLPNRPTYLRTGRRFDQYGSAAWNLGAYTTNCDWIAQLGDDDQWRDDAATIIRQSISSTHTIDIWIPGLLYNDGHQVCMTPHRLEPGNVAAPITRPEAYFTTPMTATHAHAGSLTDYAHIANLAHNGHPIGWIGDTIYHVRPHSPGRHGNGQP